MEGELKVELKPTIDEQAKSAAQMSRVLNGDNRPDLMENFVSAFKQALENGLKGERLSADLYAQYSSIIISGGLENHQKRFTGVKSKEWVDRAIDDFYSKVEKEGLTIDSLAEFWDRITLREPLLDSNTRTSVVALTHLLVQYGFEPPLFRKDSFQRFKELIEKNRGNSVQARVEFLNECLPVSLPRRSNV